MKYLILGSSAAGINAARELRLIDNDAQIIVASIDEFLYSRCILHHFIEGKRTDKQLHFAGPNVIEDYNIDFRTNHEATAVDSENKVVEFKNGNKISYDKLLIATGSSSFVPPVPNLREAKQVIGLRNFSDAQFIKDVAKKDMNVAIIGSGLVGLDALESLIKIGANVHLVDFASHLLNLQLDEHSAGVYMKAFENYGVKGHFNTLAKEVIMDEDKNVKALELDNGEVIDCSLIISAAGTRSNIGFLEGSGIELSQRGMIFNEYGETNIKDIYGAGDVSGMHPIWPMAVKEGVIAAHNMTGQRLIMDDMFAAKATMNFLNIPTLSLGNHTPKENIEDYEILIQKDNKNYKKIVLKDKKIVGAIIQGNLEYAGVLTQLIKRELDISHFNKSVFEINYSDFFSMDEKVEFNYE